MSSLRKIVPQTSHRTRVPFFDWLVKKLALSERQQPTGLPGPNGECVYTEHTRYPDTQSARSPDLPKVPGGVYHKLSSNYYYDRDARRQVEPPMPVVKNGQLVDSKINDAAVAEQIQLSISPAGGFFMLAGPSENFGLKPITPGFGYGWKRQTSTEEETQRKDRNLRKLEKFDNYRK